jgi:hypothetical protein
MRSLSNQGTGFGTTTHRAKRIKFSSGWIGPFLVVEKWNEVQYMIQKKKGGVKGLHHVDNLELCREEGLPEPWIDPKVRNKHVQTGEDDNGDWVEMLPTVEVERAEEVLLGDVGNWFWSEEQERLPGLEEGELVPQSQDTDLSEDLEVELLPEEVEEAEMTRTRRGRDVHLPGRYKDFVMATSVFTMIRRWELEIPLHPE